MTGGLKKAFKGLAIAVGVVVMILLLAICVLARPGPFFSHEKKYGAITVHSETSIGQEIDSIMADVLGRLKNVSIYNPDRKFDLCLCSTQDKFSFFARLTRRPNRTMGFVVCGSIYVNGEFLKELAIQTGGRPRYSARAGGIVHVATHELMHGYLSDSYGYFASRSLPEWKVEGYCEYGVNQFVAAHDEGYSLQERIDTYLDNSRWNPTAATHRPHFIWGLMMEYLINIKGMNLKQVMAEGVTKENVYREIMSWRRLQKGNVSVPHSLE
jgi:hypothetical protein